MDSLGGFSPVQYAIVDLLNSIGIILTFILIVVLWILLEILTMSYINPRIKKDSDAREDLLAVRRTTHGSVLEVVWTFLPSLILLGMAVPSFGLLYSRYFC